MNSDQTPQASPQTSDAGDKRGALRRKVSWSIHSIVVLFPLWFVVVVISSLLNSRRSDHVAFNVLIAFTLALAVGIVWYGRKCRWNTSIRLSIGAVVALFVLPLIVLLYLASIAGNLLPATNAINKAVLNNARQLAAAADQYHQEHGVSVCGLSDLVGPEKYVKALNTVAYEAYPLRFTTGVAITVSGVEGARTITYAP